MIPVILAGGAGTRLWPLSRKFYPKQFLALTGKETLLQATVRRLEGLPQAQSLRVVCHEEHRFLAAGQLLEIGSRARIILEPVARNTAPAVALAALDVLAAGEEGVMLVMPADHLLEGSEPFRAALAAGREEARRGALVTLGLPPRQAHTGYGYIRCGGEVNPDGTAFRVEEFIEKPAAAAAGEYVDSGRYLWNSGIFLFQASSFLNALAQHAPQILESCRRAYRQAEVDRDFLRVDGKAYAACPPNSVDYAILEKTQEAVVVPMAVGWHDVGSWAVLQEIGSRPGEANVKIGDVVALQTRNCYLRAESRLLAVLGLEDIIAVETPDAVLVAHCDKVQEVKAIVDLLDGREETLFHRRIYRPWGWFEGIARAERFQVKRIMVEPGAGLSLQMHHHRAEHWVVVKGTARVISGEKSFLLTEDQSTYIPLGQKHRLENPGTMPLEIIEVQSGAYLGEDDIVRFEDQYGRGEG